jgi:hypothetical protein
MTAVASTDTATIRRNRTASASLGHAAADRWLEESLSAVGSHSTLDLAPFAGPTIKGGVRLH